MEAGNERLRKKEGKIPSSPISGGEKRRIRTLLLLHRRKKKVV